MPQSAAGDSRNIQQRLNPLYLSQKILLDALTVFKCKFLGLGLRDQPVASFVGCSTRYDRRRGRQGLDIVSSAEQLHEFRQ